MKVPILLAGPREGCPGKARAGKKARDRNEESSGTPPHVESKAQRLSCSEQKSSFFPRVNSIRLCMNFYPKKKKKGKSQLGLGEHGWIVPCSRAAGSGLGAPTRCPQSLSHASSQAVPFQPAKKQGSYRKRASFSALQPHNPIQSHSLPACIRGVRTGSAPGCSPIPYNPAPLWVSFFPPGL